MTEDRLYRDPEIADFYDLENSEEAEDGRSDFAFCRMLAQEAGSVLDLGCGTGELAASLAEGRQVVGADPAGAMLDVARQRPGGDKVTWIEADARRLSIEQTFDLIVLTGHAFQVFLTDEAVLDVLRTIKTHLAPGGRFIFDSRNPLREEWREWTPAKSERIVIHPLFGAVRAWNDVAFDTRTDVATYWTFYEITSPSKTLSARSQIRFMQKARLEELVVEAGLVVDRWIGSWQGEPYGDDTKEIIPIGRLAK